MYSLQMVNIPYFTGKPMVAKKLERTIFMKTPLRFELQPLGCMPRAKKRTFPKARAKTLWKGGRGAEGGGAVRVKLMGAGEEEAGLHH